MQRPDSPGHDNGNFTEGDPSQGVPSTVVSAKWLNAVNKELVNVIEGAGLTIVAEGVAETDQEFTTDQLLQAIQLLAGTSSKSSDILNNQTVKVPFLDSEGADAIVLDKSKVKSAIIDYEIYRKDAVEEIKAVGQVVIAYKPIADTFEIIGGIENQNESEPEHGVEFFFDLESGDNYRLTYKSSDLSGGSYLGKLSYSIRKFLN